MGSFNGDKVVEQIKDFITQTRGTEPYIVGHSSDDRADVQEAFNKVGTDTFEVKPLKYQKLLNIIENMEKKRTQTQLRDSL
jgi:response regulator RpfG family c-di-GMP phosphodiesterase